MGSNTAHGLPYPVGTDRVMDGDNAIQALAETLDTKLLQDTGNMTPAAAGFVVASSLWTGLTGTCRRKNGTVSLAFNIVCHSDFDPGNIVNQNAVTIPTGWKPFLYASLTTATTGPGLFWYASGSGSAIVLAAVANPFNADNTMSMAGSWQV